MKRSLIPVLTVLFLLTACQKAADPAASAAAVAPTRTELTPENLTNETWQNGVLIEKNGLNGFFVTGDAAKVPVSVGAHLTFAKSGDRIVTNVVVKAPYVNIYVDKPLDPVGDGFPNKVK